MYTMGCSNSHNNTTLNTKSPSSQNNSNSYIWLEYISLIQKATHYQHNNEHHQIVYNNKTMEYTFTIKGNKPINGFPLYIALHDGEVSHSAYNTNEYKKMKTLYLPNITNGIYLVIRGISNQSNFHYMNESYFMIERLLREMIALHNADPNKVYLLGVGLGGDAVYQLASRLSDRFAALSINSGHSYGLNLKNLLGIPIQIQVGENDIAYEKNKNAVNVYITLNQLHKEYNIPLQHIECNIHINKAKHIIDYHPSKKQQTIVKDPIEWLNNTNKDIATIQHNVNAIEFVSQFQRNPFPKRLIWDLTNSMLNNSNHSISNNKGEHYVTLTDFTKGVSMLNKKNQSNNNDMNSLIVCTPHYYWLEIGNKQLNEIGTTEIIASYDKDSNTICVESKVKYVRVLLCEEMVDIEKEITVIVCNTYKQSVKVFRHFATERRCLIERGDYNFVFNASIVIEYIGNNNYKIEQYDEN